MNGLRDSGITTGRTDPKTIYKYANGQWLAFADEVDVVRSPIVDDAWERLYWCGGSKPYPKAGVRQLQRDYAASTANLADIHQQLNSMIAHALHGGAIPVIEKTLNSAVFRRAA